MMKRPLLVMTLMSLISLPAVVHAQDSAPWSLSLAGGATNAEVLTTSNVRFVVAEGWQLGADVELARLRKAFVAGFEADQGNSYEARLSSLLTIGRNGPLSMVWRSALGGGQIVVEGDVPDDRAIYVLAELGLLAHVDLTVLTIRSGVSLPVSFELTPSVNMNEQGTLVVAGLDIPLGRSWSLRADAETGGLFGSDGDSQKFLLRGVVGVRWTAGGPR